MALEAFARVKGFSCFDEFKDTQGAKGVSRGESSLGGTVSGPAKNGESVSHRPDPVGSDAKKGLSRSHESAQGEDDHLESSASPSEQESDGDLPMDDVSKQLQAEAQPGVTAESSVVRSRSAIPVSPVDQGPPGHDKSARAEPVGGTAASSTVSTAATEVGKSAQSGTASEGVEKPVSTERRLGTDTPPVSTSVSETPVGAHQPSGLPHKPPHVNTPPITPTLSAAPSASHPSPGLPPKPQHSISPQPMITTASATLGARRPPLELSPKPPPGLDGPPAINTRFNTTNGTQSSATKSPVQATPATNQPTQQVSSANQAAPRVPSTQPAPAKHPSPSPSTQAQVGQTTSSATVDHPSTNTPAAAHKSPRPASTYNPVPATKATTQVEHSQSVTIAGPSPAVKDSPASGGPFVIPGATVKSPPAMRPRVQTLSTPTATGPGLNITGPSSQSGARARASPVGSPAPSFVSTPTPQSPRVKMDTVQHFYLSEYEGPDRFWNADTPSDRLVLEINSDSLTARTLPGQPVSLEIDPGNVTTHNQFRDRPEPGKHTLILGMKDGATGAAKEHRLVFDRGGGVAASRQARRFFSWVTRM